MRIAYCHTNQSSLMRKYHDDNAEILRQDFGFDVTVTCLTDLLPLVYFNKLDRLHSSNNSDYLQYCETLERSFENIDVLLHMNGAMLHPEFLQKFSFKKIFQCSDDFKGWGGGLRVISKPVAKYYDYCAVSNVDCLDVYQSWDTKHVFWFPLGASFHPIREEDFVPYSRRTPEALFIGERKGTAYPIIGRLFGAYRREGFFNKLEKQIPIPFHGFGGNWPNGRISDEEMVNKMRQYAFGINNHSFPGSVNHRMYDMAAFGMLQFCDNKYSLKHVYKLDDEIIGYDSINELIEKIKYYADHPNQAEEIASNGHKRFLKDYTRQAILGKLIKECNL